MLSLDISKLSPEEVVARVEKEFADPADCEMELTFESSFPLSRHVRETLSFAIRRNGIDARWQNRFALISDELVNNSIEHGSKRGETNSFYMKISKDAEKMAAMLAERKKTWFTDATRKRGRGFQIMEKLVDKIYFRDAEKGGITVGVMKRFDAVTLSGK